MRTNITQHRCFSQKDISICWKVFREQRHKWYLGVPKHIKLVFIIWYIVFIGILVYDYIRWVLYRFVLDSKSIIYCLSYSMNALSIRLAKGRNTAFQESYCTTVNLLLDQVYSESERPTWRGHWVLKTPLSRSIYIYRQNRQNRQGSTIP